MIIDCHNHVASTTYLPKAFFDGWVKTIQASLGQTSPEQERRLGELFERLNSDPECEQLERQMNEAGIDQAILLVIDFGLVFPSAITIEDAHMQVRSLIQRSDRFIGFAGVDPRRGREGLDLFERAVGEWGFQGLKLYPPCGYSPSDPRLFPYYEICSARRMPVLTHVGPTSSAMSFQHTRPFDVDDAAFKFPGVNFILAHGGVMWHEEAGLLAQFRPNVFLDVSGFQSELKGDRLRRILQGHLDRGLSRRLLFGTDWPIYRFFGAQANWVKAMRESAAGILSEVDLENLFYRNIQSILPGRPSSTAEGNHA
jgi:predicted TIM-barrel fold metal-dependent hydrolase